MLQIRGGALKVVLTEDICESKMKLFKLRWHNSQIDELCWEQTVYSVGPATNKTLHARFSVLLVTLLARVGDARGLFCLLLQVRFPCATFSISRIL